MTRGARAARPARLAPLLLLVLAACGAPAGRAGLVAPAVAAAPGVELTLRGATAAAIVVDRRELGLAAGEQWLELDDLGADVTHLSVRSLSHPGGLAVLEQLVQPGLRGPRDAGWTPTAPGAPRVRLRVRASAAGTQLLELTYTLGGVGFEAEHRLTRVAADAPSASGADPAAIDLQIETWIVVNNRSGRAFRAARVTLVEDGPSTGTAAASTWVRRSHTLAAPLTIATGVELRVPLAPAITRRARRVLRFDASGGLVAPQAQQLEPYFGTGPAPPRVSEELRLEAVSLPAGRARLHDVPSDGGAAVPAVESTLELAADGRSATVPLGPGYGLSGQRRRIALDWGPRKLVERFEIAVRNDGDVAREVQVFELLYRTPSWRIVDESVAHAPAGARAVEFPLMVGPHAWGRVRYAVEYNW